MTRVTWLLALLLSTMTAAAEDLPGFSFEYQITGDRSIAPFQVFDDGVSTFLQFRDPSKVPSIFVREAAGSKLVVPQPQGNYHRIDGLVSRLEIVSDRRTATILSTRKTPRRASPTRVIPVIAEPPSAQAGPGPSKGQDEIRAQLDQLQRAVVELQQRQNGTATDKRAVVNHVSTSVATAASNSMPASAAMTVPGGSKEAAKDVYVFEAEAGQRLSEAVRRFAAARGLQLDWDTGGADFEVRHAFRIAGGSLEEVLYGALSPFKLSAIAHRGNRVLAVSRGS